MTETRLTGRVQYVCHVCGAVRPDHVPDVSKEHGQAPKVDAEPCYFFEAGEAARGEILSTESAQVVHSNSRAFIGKR